MCHFYNYSILTDPNGLHIQRHSFNPASMGPYKCWIIKQYLYWPQFLQVIFCYWSYTWAAQLIRWTFQLDIFYSCWFKGTMVPFYFFWSLFSVYQGCWRTRRLWTRCLHSWSWWIRREVVKKYHNSHCGDTLGGLFEGLPDLELFSPTTEVSIFLEHQHTDSRNYTVHY